MLQTVFIHWAYEAELGEGKNKDLQRQCVGRFSSTFLQQCEVTFGLVSAEEAIILHFY